MPTIPVAVGTRAGQWDQQNVDLTSAGTLLADASTAGFTAVVRGTATAFTTAWHAHVAAQAVEAEGFADGLRATIQAWWDSDTAAQQSLTHDQDVLTLFHAMQETR